MLKNIALKFLLFILLIIGFRSYAATSDYAVLVTAKVDVNKMSISLNWPVNSTAVSYRVYHRGLNSKKKEVWLLDTTLPGNVGTFNVKNIKKGASIEYKIRGNINNKFSAYGYISTGIEVEHPSNLGNIILVVEDSVQNNLSAEVSRLMMDLRSEGWMVKKTIVKRTEKVSNVKSKLINLYTELDSQLESVFLLGRVPVPYSGTFAPDGHTDHVGAWPADIYYGEFFDESYWSDQDNVSTGSRTENKNYPDDGKFDQDIVPNQPIASVGRVDFSNLPLFKMDEIQLMKQYLNRDHEYRIGKVQYKRQALVDDNFGEFGGEAFAASGFKAFTVMVGDTNIKQGKYFNANRKDNFLYSYACGGGYYTSCAGVGTTDSFVNDTINSAFTMLFGSYFGDWDSKDNFLRAPLAAKGGCLTSIWSGRPHWIFHHSAIGERFSRDIKISQYDSAWYFRYPNNSYGLTRQITFMGDPSLKLIYPKKIDSWSIKVKNDNGKKSSIVTLQWGKLKSAVGYNVYRARTLDGTYRKLNTTLITDSIFDDKDPLQGKSYYSIRAVALESTASGTYLNEAGGVIDSISPAFGSIGIETIAFEKMKVKLYPNPTKDVLHFNTNSDLIQLKIFNSEGKIINLISGNKSELNVSNLPTGIYLIQFLFKEGTVSERFIKQ